MPPVPLFGRYADLLPHAMEAILTRHPIAYLPSGTLEWHSHHLPLGLDGLVALALARAHGLLPGVSGEDPRTGASPERGRELQTIVVERLAGLATSLLADHGPARRSALAAAFTAQLAVLETIQRDRASGPRVLVRELFSAPFVRCLVDLAQGNYDAARGSAEEAYVALAAAGHQRA